MIGFPRLTAVRERNPGAEFTRALEAMAEDIFERLELGMRAEVDARFTELERLKNRLDDMEAEAAAIRDAKQALANLLRTSIGGRP